MAITQDQVNKVCEQLIAEHEEPTLAAVRSELGTGSMATIAKMVREWRKSGATTRSEETIQVTAPETVQGLAGKMAVAIWAEATKAARDELESERAAMKLEVNQVKTDLEAAYASMDEMQKRIENLEKSQEKAFQEFKRMKNEEAQLIAERTKAFAVVPHLKAHLEAAQKETEQWRAHAAELTRQFAKLVETKSDRQKLEAGSQKKASKQVPPTEKQDAA
jgi:chromosome segregation ATPase